MAFYYNCIYLVLLSKVLTCSSDININIVSDDNLNTKNDKKSFGQQLHNLLKVQESRLGSIKKLEALDDVKPTYLLRDDHYGDVQGYAQNSFEEDLSSDALLFDQSPSDESDDDNTENGSESDDEDDDYASDYDGNYKSDDDDLDDDLTTRIKYNGLSQYLRSCGRKSCKRACIAATRYGCAYYHCRNSLKRAFKRECKRTCSYC